MTHNRQQAVCRRCEVKETRAASGLCAFCRADTVPTVERTEDGLVRIADLVLTMSAAVTLAHRIADECTP